MSTPSVLMPDAEAVLRSFFEETFAGLDGFDDLEVVTRIPDARPERFLRVLRVGGGRRDIVSDRATLAIEGWSGTEQRPRTTDAGLICRTALAVLHAARGTVIDDITTLYRVEEDAGPANLPDPISEQPRYTATVTVTLRGVEL